jgi:ATP-dependent DNA ligase
MMRKKPMLAYPASAKPIDYSKPTFIQPKLDGVRCLIQHNTWGVVAYSRTGKEWKNIDHILKELVPFFEKHPNVILDGELYNHDLKNDFEKIISLVRKTKPTDKDRLESADMVQFHCYDIIDEKLSFSKRNKFIMKSFYEVNWDGPQVYYPSVKVLDSRTVFNTEGVEARHEDLLELGYEGSILRQNKPYECKRSWTLMKVKDFSDAEATIIGYEEGKGKREGHLGKFIMQDDNGIEFGCPPGKGYTYKDMKDMLNNIHDYIGKRATFIYFERTKANSYRHPLYKNIRDYE